MWRMASMRRLLAMRKAPMWEHMSAAMYTSTASTANSTAIQPLWARPRAREKSGAAASTSPMRRQMYQ